MNVSALQHIRRAVQTLNPKTVREISERPLNIALYAASEDDYRRIESFLLAGLNEPRRAEASQAFHRGPDANKALQFDLAIYDESVPAPRRALVFHQKDPAQLVKQILSDFEQDVTLPLARSFHAFRMPFIEQAITSTCRENALFSVATALPDIIPSLIALPWSVAEFTSDTAVLTTNQIKMSFLIAAASDRPIGYLEQKQEIALLIGSAFGWRALAREVVGKIPFGGGLIGKAGIAYAATKVIGLSLERIYRSGYDFSREERASIYKDAYQQGRHVAGSILQKIRPDLAAKLNVKAGEAK